MSFCFFSFAKRCQSIFRKISAPGRLRFENEMPVDGHAMPKTWVFQDTSARSTQRTAEERIALQKRAAAVHELIDVLGLYFW